MTLDDAIYQLVELGRRDDVRASQARQMAAWLRELRELRNKMRSVDVLFGKGQIERLRREMKQMRAASEVPLPVPVEAQRTELSSMLENS